MRYKSLFYNVEPFAKRIPDDCLKIVIAYAYDDSLYDDVKEFLSRKYCCIWTSPRNECQVHIGGEYVIQKNHRWDIIYHYRANMPLIVFELNNMSELTIKIWNYNADTVINKISNDVRWYFDDGNYLIHNN